MTLHLDHAGLPHDPAPEEDGYHQGDQADQGQGQGQGQVVLPTNHYYLLWVGR